MKSLLCAIIVLAGATCASAAEAVLYQPVPVPDGVVLPTPAGAPVVGLPLYTNVRVKDRGHIHPCAVSKIVEVPDPCNPCCCVLVEICVPPCDCPCDVCEKGCKVKYDYGKYEVDICSKNGRITVDYDN